MTLLHSIKLYLSKPGWASCNGAIAVSALFVILAGTIIAVGHGLPYIMDGNETYSSLLHARNILTFGFAQTAGLADEASGLAAAGHPMAHTHQGNFPRLFATLLYWLGITSPEAQIIVTTFVIGLPCVILLFQLLRRYLGAGIALWTMLFLITDYAYFDQWVLVTYRIWLPALLVCALAITQYWHDATQKSFKSRRRILGAALLLYVCMAYYEVVFMTFIAVTAGVWNLWLNRKNLRHAFTIIGVQIIGVIIGAGALVIQLIRYLGWEGFLTDVRITYFARNEGVNGPDAANFFQTFVEQHNIASFRNFQDGSLYRTCRFFKEILFQYGLEAYSPPFAYGLIILAASAVIALYWNKNNLRWPELWLADLAILSVVAWVTPPLGLLFGFITILLLLALFTGRAGRTAQRIRVTEAGLFLAICLCPILFYAAAYPLFLGFSDHVSSAWMVIFIIAAFGAAIVASRFLVQNNIEGSANKTMPLDMLVRGGIVLTFASIFAGYHHLLYDQSWTGIWRHSALATVLQRILLVLISIGAAVIAMLGPDIDPARRAVLVSHTNKAFILIGCFLIGLITVQILFPGYLYSGYMARSHNILFIPFALFIGTVVWIATGIGAHVSNSFAQHSKSILNRYMLPCSITAVLVGLCALWASAQLTMARAIPPTAFYGLAKALRSLPPEQATIIANNYGVPFTVLTGNWSYLDSLFSSAHIVRDSKKGYSYEQDRYTLWQADRNNPAYTRPNYYVCYNPTTLAIASQNLDSQIPLQNCAESGLSRLTLNKPHDGVWPENEVIAQDGPKNRWMIVKLDWDFSPYLPVPPTVEVAPVGTPTHLVIQYTYRQQDRVSEAITDASLFPVHYNDLNCKVNSNAIKTGEGRGGRIAFDANLAESTAYIAVIHAHTKTRSSEPFFSAPFMLEKGHMEHLPPCDYITDQFGKQWSTTLWQ